MKKSVPKMQGLAVPALLGGLLLLPMAGQAVASAPENLAVSMLQAADTPITGRITDEKGAGIPGVTVLVKGTSNGTQTDADGRYSITAPADATLVFSFVGYTSQEVAVGGRTAIDTQLRASAQGLSEVVVVGYLAQDRQNLTSAVSGLDVSEASKTPVPSVAQQIQGRIPGVLVQGGGAPGAYPVVTIRGIGTLGLADTGPLYVIDGLWPADPRNLVPSDIESLNVLKDASSTAVYGSRGANGVIQITTKKGSAGTPTIRFNGVVGVDQVRKKYNLTNAAEWAQRARVAYQNAGIDILNAGQNSLSGAVPVSEGGTFDPSIDTDWQDEFFQTGRRENYNLSFSGGSKGDKSSSNFLVSGDYFHQEGIVKGPDYKRYSLRLNSGMSRGRFRFQENFQLSRIDATLLNGAPFIDVLTMIPSIPVLDSTNEGGFGTGSTRLNTFATNPVGAQQLLRRRQSENRVLGNISADFSIFDFLTYRLNLGVNAFTYANDDAQQTGIIRQNTRITAATLNEFLGYGALVQAENTLNFTKAFGDHRVNALVGYSEQRSREHNVQAGASGFTSRPRYFFELSAGTEKGAILGTSSEYAIRSFFTQATYDYKNRYLLSVSGRRDASSRFAPQNQRADFGAASIGWRISEEDFFKSALPQVNNLKLRASYGVLGNENLFNNYLPYAVVAQNVNYVIGTGQQIVNGATQIRINSPDVQWEERATRNIGLDLALLDNRLNFSADYYIADTRNALISVQVPTYLGNFEGDPIQNGGELQNKGLEVALGFHENRSAFTYGADFTLTTVRNRITKVLDEGQAIGGGDGPTRSQLGHSVGEFYLIQFDGIFQTQEEVTNHKSSDGTVIQAYASPGDVRYKDLNDDGKIDNADRAFSGSAIPKLQLGLNLNAGYKNFDLSLFWQSATGNEIYNVAKRALESYNGPNNYDADVTPWSPANPSTTTPRLLQGGSPNANLAAAAAQNSLANSTRWLESGNYLRLKNIQLGYTIPKNLTSRVPSLGTVRVYVTGTNLLTFTDYSGFDPETGGTGFYSRGIDDSSYPNTRTVVGGLQVNF
ncbi:TonB-dependent receptor [Hymenobacter sp. BT683]|uniref:TonB-dependent receptor n=1 Tax=Hymenobacter jeongseonensis TaxID=2791027 RepID=A0ABS0ILA3_9BACT|nr:TonB-dependent receptor [Hymenobacter jeongseonensis]MBF9238550.1 TonB-dependent receptor [Hymenobacter jeongseonensis]